MRRSLILLAACLCAAYGNLHAEDWIATLQTAGRYVAVETRDSLAFFASEWGLEIFSIADPTNPLRLSSMPTPGTADNLEIDDRYVYLADQSNGLLVIDCQDPYAPQVVRTLSHNLTDLTTGEGGHSRSAATGYRTVPGLTQ
jgi:hypothetical protein